MSRCSRSMFVTTAIVGVSLRNERSDSSASATRNSPLPSRAPEPRTPSRPPTTTVGSSPPRSSTSATIEVVVVLPWLPATATPYLSRISSASISARGMTGMPRAARLGDLGVVAAAPRSRSRPRGRPRRSRPRGPRRRARPERGEPVRHRGALQVGAGHRVAEVQQHLGDAAHAGAADPDEVDVLDPPKHAHPARPARSAGRPERDLARARSRDARPRRPAGRCGARPPPSRRAAPARRRAPRPRGRATRR